MAYECFTCRKVFVTGEQPARCQVCEGSNIEPVSIGRLTKGLETGAYYNIDPKTGGRAKPKRRR
jgi:hypothetical protein